MYFFHRLSKENAWTAWILIQGLVLSEILPPFASAEARPALRQETLRAAQPESQSGLEELKTHLQAKAVPSASVSQAGLEEPATVEEAMERWFRPKTILQEEIEDEKQLQDWLAKGGEQAIRRFVQLIERDRAESLGSWEIPALDFDNPDFWKRLPPLGSRVSVSVERTNQGLRRAYDMPKTKREVGVLFERERFRVMAQVAVQRALGRKVVVPYGLGMVGTANLLVASSSLKNLPEKKYPTPLKYRGPLSGKDRHPIFALGFQRHGPSLYRQDMLARGLVGIRTGDVSVKQEAREAHERNNMTATFLPEVVRVADFVSLSVEQHPHKTMPGHPEAINADPEPGLAVLREVARRLAPNACCVVESTVFPLYTDRFAWPEFEKVLSQRSIPEKEMPVLVYIFQRLEPGAHWLRSNRNQERVIGAPTPKAQHAGIQYVELMGFRGFQVTNIVDAESVKDSENAFRYQMVASSGPYQAMFEALREDIYRRTHRIVGSRLQREVSAHHPGLHTLLEAVASLQSVVDRAREFAEDEISRNPTDQGRVDFLKGVLSVMSEPTSAILSQAILCPGGYCVIEQIGHLIYGLIASNLAEELDVKVIFRPALATIGYMRMRQHHIANWILGQLAHRGIDPWNASMWVGGVTYARQVDDARNGSVEQLVRHLADAGVADFTVFEPYAERWDQIQQQDPLSPESEGYGLVRQLWLRLKSVVDYQFGRRQTSNGDEPVDPHTTFKPKQNVVILSMDHPQLVGAHQPSARRTDGYGVTYPGLDAIKISARMLGREGKILLDTHYFLSDQDIKEFLALGWQVRALGRGHIDRLQHEVASDRPYREKTYRRLLDELEGLRFRNGDNLEQIDDAIEVVRDKIQGLHYHYPQQDKTVYSPVFPADPQKVLNGLVESQMDPAVEKVRTQMKQMARLADALATQIIRDRKTKPADTHEMLRHLQRIHYLIGLFRNLRADLGLAAKELFQPEARRSVSIVQEGLSGQITDEDLLASVRLQFQGVNGQFQQNAELTGTVMGTADQKGTIVHAIVNARPVTHSPLQEQPGLVADPELVAASHRLTDMYQRVAGVSLLHARSELFSYQANIDVLMKRPEEVAQKILMELAGLGLTAEQARVYLSGRVGVQANAQAVDQRAMDQMRQALQGVGISNVTLARENELPAQGVRPEENVVILTANRGFTKSMDVAELIARTMAREGNLLYDANNALNQDRVLDLLAAGWRVAGIGRGDAEGRQVLDVHGNPRHIPGLVDEVTKDRRLRVYRRVLKQFKLMKGDPSVDSEKLTAAILTVRAKVAYLRTEGEKQVNLEWGYRSLKNGQEQDYETSWISRNRQAALNKAVETVVPRLERELADLLRETARVSMNLHEQISILQVHRPRTPEEFQEQMRRLIYLDYITDEAIVDSARAADVLFNSTGQEMVRDEVDHLWAKERGDRLTLPVGWQPEQLPVKYQASLFDAPMTPGLVQKEKERLAQQPGETGRPEQIGDEGALRSLKRRFQNRFTEAGDLRVLPALRIHPDLDGRTLHIEVDEDHLSFRSLRFLLDAAKGKGNSPVDWVKYTALVPLFVVPMKSEEEPDRAFDYFITQELLRSSLPWRTKQWLATEVLGKGNILTTIRAEDATSQHRLAVLMQGNPYADVGASKDAGGSGRAGFLVSLERADERPELVVTVDERGHEKLIEIKGVGPMFGRRTPDVVRTMVRTIAGGVKMEAPAGRLGGETPTVQMVQMAQLYGLVRGPQVDSLLRLVDQPARKQQGAVGGVALAVNHTLPREAPDVIVGQVWRTVPGSDRLGFQLFKGEEDYQPDQLAQELGWNLAEMLGHFGDGVYVHIASGLDNTRWVARGSYFTDEDSLVDVANERDPFAAFDYYFRWSLAFVSNGYATAKAGTLEQQDYTYFQPFLDAFLTNLLESPILRRNSEALRRFRLIARKVKQAGGRFDFGWVIDDLMKELHLYVAYRILDLRLAYGYDPKADSVYTSNAGKNFRRGELTAKGPRRETASGLEKPSAQEEAGAFLQAEERLLGMAQEAMTQRGGYAPLPFNFTLAHENVAGQHRLLLGIAQQEGTVVTDLIRVGGWQEMGYEKAYQRLVVAAMAVPGLRILSHLPSYEPVYRLDYYPPRAQLHYAKVFEEDTFRGGNRYPRLQIGTVQATGLFDKAAAQMAVAEAALQKIPATAGLEENTAQVAEVFDVEGAIRRGDEPSQIKALILRNPVSPVVVVYHHGLGGNALESRIAGWINEAIRQKASLVTFTSSRYRSLLTGERLSPQVFDEVFGAKDQAKSFEDEAEELRRVVKAAVAHLHGKGVPEQEVVVILVGQSLGGQIVPIVAADLPQVRGIVDITGSPETFSGSGLPKEQWHPLVTPPDLAAMRRRFAAFQGAAVFILADEDLPARNGSILALARHANPQAPLPKIYRVPGPHQIRDSAAPAVQRIIADFVDSVTQRVIKKDAPRQTGLEESSRFALTLPDASLQSTVETSPTMAADLPQQIVNAHRFALSLPGGRTTRSIFEQSSIEDPMIRLATEWSQLPRSADAQQQEVQVASRLGPYVAPEEMAREPELLRAVQQELVQLQKDTPIQRILHLGMGGSAEVGAALSGSGLLQERPASVVDTSDPSVWSGLLSAGGQGTARAFLESSLVVAMSMGMTSEEPVINLAYLSSLFNAMGVPLGQRLRLLTLDNSSVHQYAGNQGMERQRVDLQPNGLQTSAGRMSAPLATRFPLWFLGLNGHDLTQWAKQAQLSAQEQQEFVRLGTALAVLAEQGKNKITLVLPKELAFLAAWIKQAFEESLGLQGKGLKPEAPRFLIKIVIDEPLDPAFYREAAESDRAFLTIQAPNSRLSPEQAAIKDQLAAQGHPVINFSMDREWQQGLAGLMQGVLYSVAAVAHRWDRPFVTQPGVEAYKALAKQMIIQAMLAGGFLQPDDVDSEGRVAAEKYFPALVKWVLREDSSVGSLDQTEVYRHVWSSDKVASALDGQIRVVHAGIDQKILEKELQASGGRPADAVAVVRAIVALKKEAMDAVGGRPFRPTPEITHYGDTRFTDDGRALSAVLQEVATTHFRRPWRSNVDVGEGPRINHEYHEMILNDPSGVSIILLPEVYKDALFGHFSSDYIRAQALATYLALVRAGRTVILMTYPRNNEAGRSVLKEFFKQVAVLPQDTIHLKEQRTGLEERILLPAGATAGKVIFVPWNMATPEVFHVLAQLKPARGERLNLVVFAEYPYQKIEIRRWLKDAHLEDALLELVVVQGNPYDALTLKQRDYLKENKVLVLWTWTDLMALGEFLQIPEASYRTLEKWIEEEELAPQA